MPPTDEQQAVINSRIAPFVEACPGAGKTHAIVARLVRLLDGLPPRRGVGVLSFTNAALEEFTKRSSTAGISHLLTLPHYVGTFDSFVRHFLVLPGGISGCDVRPTIVDSWRAIGVEVRLRGRNAFRGSGISLDLFDAETGRLAVEQIGMKALRDHAVRHRQAYEQVARATRANFRRAGTLSSSDARLIACLKIRRDNGARYLGEAIAGRFAEVLVDEAQDCNPLDLEVLEWLRRNGVPVTMVADLDQAIYEFRRSVPADLAVVRESYPAESRLRLTGNFRSSPAICAVAATLRSTGAPDRSVGDSAACADAVILSAYDGAPSVTIGGFASEFISGRLGDSTESILLAHNRRLAERCVGRESADGGASKLASLAKAVAVFHSETVTLRARETALLSVEALLLDYMGRRDTYETVSQALARNMMNRRVSRRQALELVSALPNRCQNTLAESGEWMLAARRALQHLDLPCAPDQTVARFFRTPGDRSWSRPLLGIDGVRIVHSTVHEAKGKQFDAVAFVIPPDRAPGNRTEQLFAAWRSRHELESKRVAYVAVTRARRLLMICLPVSYLQRCKETLEAAGVPCELSPVTQRLEQA